MTVCIYGLVDPRTEEIRYIGKTEQIPDCRLTQHVHRARTTDRNTHLLNWLRLMLDADMVPSITILEIVDAGGPDWQEREREWIAHGHESGWPLTNSTSGGEGIIDPSPEVRKARSVRMKGNKYASGNLNAVGKRSDAFRKRMAEVAKVTRNALGHTLDEETRKTISNKLKMYYANGGERMRGERQAQSKLTEQDVRTIRQRYAEGNVSYRALAGDYGLSYSAIRNAATGRSWRHLEEE